ncbi:MAG TPA: hypothetical protein VII94_02740 [Candidatus Saccharimonadales bacterium]
MTLKSTAQELFVIDPISPASQLQADVHEVHSRHDSGEHHEMAHELEVSEPIEIEIVVDELPGAPPGTKDPEPVLEVSEPPSMHVEEKEDANDAKKGNGKNDKWNWSAHGPHGFVAWVKSRIDDVPKHSGYDSAGLERAMAYFDRLDNEISKAMRMDVDGELDANKVEAVRSQLDEGLARLQARLDKVKETKKSSRKRKKSAEYEVDDEGFIKEAQKITGVQGVYVTVPLLISRVARVCINGTVSAGHDIEDLYKRQVDRYKLNEREQAEVQQLLFDMGYPLRQDRGFMPDDDMEVWDTDNMDWAANYRG